MPGGTILPSTPGSTVRPTRTSGRQRTASIPTCWNRARTRCVSGRPTGWKPWIFPSEPRENGGRTTTTTTVAMTIMVTKATTTMVVVATTRTTIAEGTAMAKAKATMARWFSGGSNAVKSWPLPFGWTSRKISRTRSTPRRAGTFTPPAYWSRQQRRSNNNNKSSGAAFGSLRCPRLPLLPRHPTPAPGSGSEPAWAWPILAACRATFRRRKSTSQRASWWSSRTTAW
mmetsp:Transcript_102430/g.208518  ORF Transcript_102430/g.208518 Transcript_102430/m.208518 type:complete len:228 (+) Transcript_102430:259-942(+)